MLWFERGEPGRFAKGEKAVTKPLAEGEGINGDLTAIIFSGCEPAIVADTALQGPGLAGGEVRRKCTLSIYRGTEALSQSFAAPAPICDGRLKVKLT